MINLKYFNRILLLVFFCDVFWAERVICLSGHDDVSGNVVTSSSSTLSTHGTVSRETSTTLSPGAWKACDTNKQLIDHNKQLIDTNRQISSDV